MTVVKFDICDNSCYCGFVKPNFCKINVFEFLINAKIIIKTVAQAP